MKGISIWNGLMVIALAAASFLWILLITLVLIDANFSWIVFVQAIAWSIWAAICWVMNRDSPI